MHPPEKWTNFQSNCKIIVNQFSMPWFISNYLICYEPMIFISPKSEWLHNYIASNAMRAFSLILGLNTAANLPILASNSLIRNLRSSVDCNCAIALLCATIVACLVERYSYFIVLVCLVVLVTEKAIHILVISIL